MEAPIEDALLHLELGDAVAQQAADAIGLLEHRHEMARAVQLIRSREPRRSRSDDRHLLPRPRRRWPRRHPSFPVRTVDDRYLDVLDGHRVVVDSEHARPFARRGTETARELREVVRHVQAIDGRLPLVAVDEIVPVRNEVAERTALMTERDAAVHAARTLLHQVAGRRRQIHLAPVMDALLDGTSRVLAALDLDEPCWLTHGVAAAPSPTRPASTSGPSLPPPPAPPSSPGAPLPRGAPLRPRARACSRAA